VAVATWEVVADQVAHVEFTHPVPVGVRAETLKALCLGLIYNGKWFVRWRTIFYLFRFENPTRSIIIDFSKRQGITTVPL